MNYVPSPAAPAARKPHKLQVDKASPGFALLLQSGVELFCRTGIPLKRLLHEELGLTPEQSSHLDVFLLNGKPVDNPQEALVPSGSRLALAAGLPGIAGLAMKSDSAVKGLRPGITHGAGEKLDAPGVPPGPGSIELVLYSLALKRLAAHFLGRGFYLAAPKLRQALQEGLHGQFFQDDAPIEKDELIASLGLLPPDSSIFLTARMADDS